MPVSWWALYGRINASLDYNFTGTGKPYICHTLQPITKLWKMFPRIFL